MTAIQTLAKPQITFFGYVWKYKFLIMLFIILLPGVIGSIKTAQETHNPSYPLVFLGLKLSNADSLNYNIIQNLKTEPSKILGMEKPTEGIFIKIKYYWRYFWRVIWEIISNLMLMFLPLIIIYKLLSKTETYSVYKNFVTALFLYIVLIIFTNMLLLIDGLMSGSQFVNIPQDANQFIRFWKIIILVLPFKGLFALVMYIVSLFYNR